MTPRNMDVQKRLFTPESPHIPPHTPERKVMPHERIRPANVARPPSQPVKVEGACCVTPAPVAASAGLPRSQRPLEPVYHGSSTPEGTI